MTATLDRLASITRLYRARAAAISATLSAAVDTLWQQLYDPADPIVSLGMLGRTVGTWTTAGQLSSAIDATNYLAQIWASVSGQPIPEVTTFTIPPELLGMAYTGGTVNALTRTVPNVFQQRLDLTESLAMAETSARAFLDGIVVSEPNRAGNQTILHNAINDERYTGRYHRRTAPGACAFCTLIADRGYIEANAGFQPHRHCRCTPEPEPALHLASRWARQRASLAERAAAGDVQAQQEQERVMALARERARRHRARVRAESAPFATRNPPQS